MARWRIVLLQSQSEGLKIVALGGGHGLSTLLRGLKQYKHPTDLTAIVTVADDGGSSGRLRREMGVLPPGDFRNCLIALAGIPQKSVQQTLLSTALQKQLKPEIRQVAGYQMAYHVQRHGWLLSDAAVQDLHRVHDNEPESEVATALAAVIGSLKPNSKLIGEGLNGFQTTQ